MEGWGNENDGDVRGGTMSRSLEARPETGIAPPERDARLLQRSCACGQHTKGEGECAECGKRKLQRRAGTGRDLPGIPPIVDAVLRAPGRPLEAETRGFMEPRFSHDFSRVRIGGQGRRLSASDPAISSPADQSEREAELVADRVTKSEGKMPERSGWHDFGHVRVHTDSAAAESAAAVNALAYTVGNHIVFGAGRYAPADAGGRSLLAHELTHVAQQERAGTETGMVQRSAYGFFSNIFQSIFGYDFSPSTLEEYLKLLDTSGKIEDDYDSDNKAVQIVRSWNKDEALYVLTPRRKALLILEMLSGFVGGDDQGAILDLLERSDNATLDYIFGAGGVKHEKLLSEFGGKREQLYRFYQRRFPDAYNFDDVHFGNPEPKAPDLKKLNETKPGDEKIRPGGNVVQTGDPLPETGNTLYSSVKSKETKKRTEPISLSDADQWINEIYGAYIPDDKKPTAKGGYAETNVTLTETQPTPDSDRFEEAINNCLTYGIKRAECEYMERSTQAFYDRDSSSIVVRTDRETPSTRLHEVIHAYSHKNTQNLAQFAKEGLTEYFTRQIILRRSASGKHPKEKPPAIEQTYSGPYQAILELSLEVGEDFLAKVYFQGNIKSLCERLGKSRYDKWSEAMKSQDGWQDAITIQRTKEPAAPAKAGGSSSEGCS
ncbi:MAG: DUF4157 domain-containing protein [Bacteroidota bacterium]